MNHRFTSWTRLLLALSLATAVAVFPCRVRADDGGNHGNDGNSGGGNNGGGNNGGGNNGGGNNGGGPGNNNRGHGHRDATQVAGTFLIVVRGYFATDPASSSANTATVSATTVTLHAQVKDDGGHSFAFDANLRITDNYHFSGNGTIGSTTVTIEGHVDPTDPASRGNGQNSPVVSNPRLECTYTTVDPANRHSGRVVGSMAPPAAPANSSH